MKQNKIKATSAIVTLTLLVSACMLPSVTSKVENKNVPATFNDKADTLNSVKTPWTQFFTDPYLIALIDVALKNNQELNIMLQEIAIAKNETLSRKGTYLPYVGLGVGAGVDKSAKYTRMGAVDESLDIMPEKKIPNTLQDYGAQLNVAWEIDIWKKLRNAKKSAVYRYLATSEGKNFMVTRLVAEIATDYYELIALDNQLEILKQNIKIQQNALEIVKQEKVSARVTELAVRKFEAEVFKNQSRQNYILQSIIEIENQINFMLGRFPQPIERAKLTFSELTPVPVHAGIPSQLLSNRPDLKRAEYQLEASKLDVKSARAQFYPTFMITGAVGYQSYSPSYLFNPASMLYNVAGNLMTPLFNRTAIKAAYQSANATQIQAVYNYERTILNAYREVVNQLSNIYNLQTSYTLREKQVEALNRSINISTILFKSARADYMEILMTQRDALEARFDLVDTKMQQMHAMIDLYQALGGGWK